MPATTSNGSRAGMVMRNKVRKNPAPSTCACSKISCGIAVRPASTMIVASGSNRHTLIIVTAPNPSHSLP